MKTIAIANQKGGVGKTTTALNLADALIHCNFNVLFVDMDPQCNSTDGYRADNTEGYTIHDVLNSNCNIWESIHRTEFGDIIPGSPRIQEDEVRYITEDGGFMLLRNALDAVKDDYDFCIIDTPPNLGVFMINAMNASDGLIIPVTASKYALSGLNDFLENYEACANSTNPDLKIYGALITNFDKRTSLGKLTEIELPKLGETLGFPVFKQLIRRNQTVEMVQANSSSLFNDYPTCNAAVDYAKFCMELLSMLGYSTEGIEQ